MTRGDALNRYLAAHADRYIEELREFCAIPSEASHPEALSAAAAWCRQRLAAAGCAVRTIEQNGIPPLVVGEAGGGSRTLLAVQHYDVQPAVPLELWHSPPYDPALRDGAVYARGVDDNKGHLLLRIQAVEAHRDVFGDLPIRVRFLVEGEEESGSVNLPKLLEREPALLDADGALKEGGGVDAAGRPLIYLGNKGILYVQLRLRSMAIDAHSGYATHLPNAAWRLTQALATVLEGDGRVRIAGFYDQVRPPTPEEREQVAAIPFEAARVKEVYGIDRFAFGRRDDAARDASVLEPTANLCGLWGGYTGPGTKTVIPAEAAAKLDFRLVPDQDPAAIAALLRAHLDAHGFSDVQMVPEEGERPYRGPVNHPLVRAVRTVLEEAFEKPAVVAPNGGGTAPMWLVSHRHRLANVTLGMSYPAAAVHAPNEHVVLDRYWRALRATAQLYRLFAGQE